MRITPFLAVTGVLLLFALSFLVQLAFAKWRYEKKQAERRLDAARRKKTP